jgi:hypothetical protein
LRDPFTHSGHGGAARHRFPGAVDESKLPFRREPRVGHRCAEFAGLDREMQPPDHLPTPDDRNDDREPWLVGHFSGEQITDIRLHRLCRIAFRVLPPRRARQFGAVLRAGAENNAVVGGNQKDVALAVERTLLCAIIKQTILAAVESRVARQHIQKRDCDLQFAVETRHYAIGDALGILVGGPPFGVKAVPQTQAGENQQRQYGDQCENDQVIAERPAGLAPAPAIVSHARARRPDRSWAQ